MEIEFNSAIYKITNVVNNKCYIGSDVDVYTRLAVHRSGLKYRKQPNKHLQSAYDKYGLENFRFKILEYVSKEAKANMKAAWVKRKAIKNNGWSTAWV